MNTTTTLTLTVAVWLVTLKVVAGWLWWKNRQMLKLCATLGKTLIAAGHENAALTRRADDGDAHVDSLNELLGEVLVERDTLRRQMEDIFHTIQRRPPRRKWLARARRVAAIASGAAAAHDEMRRRGIKVIAGGV